MKLSEYQKSRSLTDEQMADLIGDITVSAYRKWRFGERLPRRDQMERIFEKTGHLVTPNDFYDLGIETADPEVEAPVDPVEATR